MQPILLYLRRSRFAPLTEILLKEQNHSIAVKITYFRRFVKGAKKYNFVKKMGGPAFSPIDRIRNVFIVDIE